MTSPAEEAKVPGRRSRRRIVVCLAVVICLLVAGRIAWDELRPGPPREKLVFVYVHGFGGKRDDPRFCVNMKEFLAKVNYDCEIRNYPWDSVDIKVMKAGANWLEAKKRAKAEAPRFKSAVIDKLESDDTPYVLVGYSIGSRVVLDALAASKNRPRMLRGVYFLGSAMTRDTTIDRSRLPVGMKITNYHSPVRDTVHQVAFNFIEEIPAGGRAGFADTNVFENLAVSCSHIYKAALPHTDYSQLAHSIGYVALLKERVFVPGDTSMNIPSPVGDGNVWWNKILRMECVIEEQPCTLEIEQLNLDRDYFRAIVVLADGTRRRVARGKNIHAILNHLGVLPESYWRKRK